MPGKEDLNYEDGMNDLRDRAQALGYQHVKEGFPHLQIEFDTPRQDSGGMELIHAWAESHPNRRLLIIDPLVKFRRYRRRGERELDTYQLDYAVIGEIHSEAIKYGFSVLTLQHENKIPGIGWVLCANVNIALTAATSSFIRLDRKRGQLDAKLSITGRGVKDSHLPFERSSRKRAPGKNQSDRVTKAAGQFSCSKFGIARVWWFFGRRE